MKVIIGFLLWSYVGYFTDKIVRIELIVAPWLKDVWKDLIVSGPADLLKAIIWWAVSLCALWVYEKKIKRFNRRKDETDTDR